jgi:Domain of unknown function (DUF4386)
MTPTTNASRVAGVLILVQAVGGYLTNFGLIGPATAAPGFLVNAAPHALRVGISALLGIATGALAMMIAITVWPVLKKHSERMALSYLALGIAALALAVVENGRLMSMLSLSQAYAASGATDPATFAGLRGVVAASRNWAHFTHLIVGGSTFFVLYATTFRFALLPRLLAGFGMAAAALQMATVSMPLLGGHVIFPLLAPAGIANLALAVWLLTKGLADKDPASAT